MDSWQDSFINWLPVLMFMWGCNILRPILAPELEKRLKRKLTDWEWSFYLLDSYLKGKAEHQQQIMGKWYQQLVDLKIIHDFESGGE
ncbi:hypothetical protein ACFLVG_04610 [Chloroflexota bacterium]